eukprot:1024968-Lingulodinium_polyedra.AAC.1
MPWPQSMASRSWTRTPANQRLAQNARLAQLPQGVRNAHARQNQTIPAELRGLNVNVTFNG